MAHSIWMRFILTRDRSESYPNAPGPELYTTMFPDSPQVSPTDQQKTGLGNHRKALAVVGENTYPPSNPQYLSLNPIAHDPLAAPWPSPRHSGTFLNDSSEHENSPISPAFRSLNTTSSDVQDFGSNRDNRRPSAASATTVSSAGSKSSQNERLRKRLQGFFSEGNVRQELESHPDETSPQEFGSREHSGTRARNDSVGSRNVSESAGGRPISPNPSRPRTPLPSSDVAPWMYQQFGVSELIQLTCIMFPELTWCTPSGYTSVRRGSCTQSTNRLRWPALLAQQ
jgi:adenylate cyclase